MAKEIPRIGGGVQVSFNANAFTMLLNAHRLKLAEDKGRITLSDSSGSLKLVCPERMFQFIEEGDPIAVTISCVKAAIIEPEAPRSSIILPGSDNDAVS